MARNYYNLEEIKELKQSLIEIEYLLTESSNSNSIQKTIDLLLAKDLIYREIINQLENKIREVA